MEERMNEEKYDSWKICVSTASRIHATLSQYLSRMRHSTRDRTEMVVCVSFEKEHINTHTHIHIYTYMCVYMAGVHIVSLCVCVYIYNTYILPICHICTYSIYIHIFILWVHIYGKGFLWRLSGKGSSCQRRGHKFNLGQEDLLEQETATYSQYSA